MNISKRLAAGLLSAVLLCSFTGCKEQGAGPLAGGNSSNSSSESNTSVIEDPPKEFHEVLADMAAIKSYNYSTELNANYVKTDYIAAPDPNDGFVMEKTPQTFNLSFAGSAGENGDFELNNFVVNADLFGEGNKDYPLIDLAAVGDKVYVNVKPVVNIIKEMSDDDTSIPAVLEAVEYVVITPEDVNKYGEMLTSQMGGTGDMTTVETDASVNAEAMEKAFTEAGKVISDFAKALYDKNKDLIKRTDTTYALTINKSNYKDYVAVLNAMIDDGSLKKLIEDVAKPLSAIPSFEISLDDVDTSIAELKEQLAALTDEDVPDFNITYELTDKGSGEYVLTFTASTPDEDGNMTSVKLISKITAESNVNISAPASAMTIDELVLRLQEEMSATMPEDGIDDTIDPSFTLPMNTPLDAATGSRGSCD